MLPNDEGYCGGSGCLVFAEAEHFLEDVALLGDVAGLDVGGVGVGGGAGAEDSVAPSDCVSSPMWEQVPCGCGAVEEGGGEAVAGAGVVGEQVGGAVDADDVDAVGRGEGLHVGVLRELDGAVHELGPDGRGGDGAGELDVGVVVVADPDDADEVGGVAGEPGVVGGAGFAGGGSGEAVLADGGAVAEVHDAFEQRLGEVGGAGVHDLLGFGGEVGDDVAVGVADAGEQPGVEVDAAVGEDGVGAGHVERCGVVGAERDGRACRGRWRCRRRGARAATLSKPTCWPSEMVALLSECARA